MQVVRDVQNIGIVSLDALRPGQCFVLAAGVTADNYVAKMGTRAVYMVCRQSAGVDQPVQVVSLESGNLFTVTEAPGGFNATGGVLVVECHVQAVFRGVASFVQ